MWSCLWVVYVQIIKKRLTNRKITENRFYSVSTRFLQKKGRYILEGVVLPVLLYSNPIHNKKCRPQHRLPKLSTQDVLDEHHSNTADQLQQRRRHSPGAFVLFQRLGQRRVYPIHALCQRCGILEGARYAHRWRGCPRDTTTKQARSSVGTTSHRESETRGQRGELQQSHQTFWNMKVLQQTPAHKKITVGAHCMGSPLQPVEYARLQRTLPNPA